MDIFFQDPTAIPLPPDEVRIRQFQAELWPDKRRVRIHLVITPFQVRPSGEITITDEEGTEVAAFSIIETISPRMEFTVHLRGDQDAGKFTASASLFYYEEEDPHPSGSETEESTRLPSRVRIVDRAETTFEI
jgi:hypothetical protein